jgi:hypothetical protein
VLIVVPLTDNAGQLDEVQHRLNLVIEVPDALAKHPMPTATVSLRPILVALSSK